MSSVSKLNYKIIFHLMGLLLLFNGGFMLIASIFSFIYDDGVGFEMVMSGVITLLIGGFLCCQREIIGKNCIRGMDM